MSLRNVGELAGVLSRTYVPTLGDHNKKERSTYGNGRFKFPENYQNDGNNGNFVGFGVNDGDEEDEEEENEEEEEEDNNDNHYIVSLIACEIFQQKQKEKDFAVEKERNKFLIEGEKGRVERLNQLHAIAMHDMKEERERENERGREREREKEVGREREREREIGREKEVGKEKEKNRMIGEVDYRTADVEVDRGKEERIKVEKESKNSINESKSFWDALLLKPLSPKDRERELESRKDKAAVEGKKIEERERDRERERERESEGGKDKERGRDSEGGKDKEREMIGERERGIVREREGEIEYDRDGQSGEGSDRNSVEERRVDMGNENLRSRMNSRFSTNFPIDPLDTLRNIPGERMFFVYIICYFLF